MTSGEIYFNYIVTLGRDLPYLPIEVRKNILSKILYKLNCMSCNEIYITYNHSIVIEYSNGNLNKNSNVYSINNLFLCNICSES